MASCIFATTYTASTMSADKGRTTASARTLLRFDRPEALAPGQERVLCANTRKTQPSCALFDPERYAVWMSRGRDAGATHGLPVREFRESAMRKFGDGVGILAFVSAVTVGYVYVYVLLRVLGVLAPLHS
jgi:hypothetical protein